MKSLCLFTSATARKKYSSDKEKRRRPSAKTGKKTKKNREVTL
jgi:hypothetical protein